MPKDAEEQLNNILLDRFKQTSNLDVNSKEFDAVVSKSNADAAKVLFNHGIDVVKYRNVSPMETSKISYFLTDPSIIYQPEEFNVKGKYLLGTGLGLGTGLELLNKNQNKNESK